MASATAVRLADLTASASTGCCGAASDAAGSWAFLDLTGGVKPYLLTGIDNHRGARTDADLVDLDRLRRGRPHRRRALARPRCRSRCTSSPRSTSQRRVRRTTLTTTFTYHDGYWDPADREFRGFGRVEQTDALTPATAPPAAPATAQPLDPLTPRYAVPAGFDPAGAGNLLANWSFDAPGTRADHAHHDRRSAVRRRGGGRARLGHVEQRRCHHDDRARATSRSPASCRRRSAGPMLHVTTDGDGCGIVQVFAAPDGPPERALTSVWLYLVRGNVAVGTGDGRQHRARRHLRPEPGSGCWSRPGTADRRPAS